MSSLGSVTSPEKRFSADRLSSDGEKYRFSSCACASSQHNKFQELREGGLLCDVTLKVQGMEVPAHKIVLAAKSPYFRGMFSASFSERDLSVIELDKKRNNDMEQEDPTHIGLSAEEFSKCIDFIYTGTFEINKSAELETLVEIVKVANFLELGDLKEWVIEIVVDVKTNYLKYDNMKVVTNMFAPYDDKNIIKETVRSEVVANWEDYVDEFPDDWEFVLTVWPDFRLPFKISSSESLDGLTKALRNLGVEALNLRRDPGSEEVASVELAKTLDLFKCRNPESYFECRTKLEPDMTWLGRLDSDIMRDEGDVLLATEIIANILKEKRNETGQRSSFQFPLHLMKNFGSSIEVRQSLGKLLDDAKVRLEFSWTNEKKEQDIIYDDGPNGFNVINEELSNLLNERLKQINSLLMKRADAKKPPLQHLVVSQVDLSNLWKHLLAEIAIECVYVNLKNVNISSEFLEMFVFCMERKSSPDTLPLRRVTLYDCPLSEFCRKSVSSNLAHIAANITEIDLNKSKLNAADLKDLSGVLKSKAADRSLPLRLLSLRSIETVRCLQDSVFTDLVASVECVDLAKSKIRPGQLRDLAVRVFSEPKIRIRRLGLLGIILVHDYETSDYEDFVVGTLGRRSLLPEVHTHYTQLIALLDVCSISGPSCNSITLRKFNKMKETIQELCEDREAAKRKISQLKIYPKTRTINLDHDYQASSGAGANSRYNSDQTYFLSQRGQARLWDIYNNNNMEIPDIDDSVEEEEYTEDMKDVSPEGGPKSEPVSPTPSSPTIPSPPYSPFSPSPIHSPDPELMSFTLHLNI